MLANSSTVKSPLSQMCLSSVHSCRSAALLGGPDLTLLTLTCPLTAGLRVNNQLRRKLFVIRYLPLAGSVSGWPRHCHPVLYGAKLGPQLILIVFHWCALIFNFIPLMLNTWTLNKVSEHLQPLSVIIFHYWLPYCSIPVIYFDFNCCFD